MNNYYRIILGKKNAVAAQCVGEGFVGIDYNMPDLTRWLALDDDAFYDKVGELLKAEHPGASKIKVSLACGVINKLARRMRLGDAVICSMGDQTYRVGEITGEYLYARDQPLPHRRKVGWHSGVLHRDDMSESLRGSLGGALTIIGPDSITRHRDEIERLMSGSRTIPTSFPGPPDVEDPVAFAMEKHLEEFLVRNWAQTDLSKDFTIYEDEGELVGQQFSTDVGPIDILAISRDKKRLLVLELKRGRASDVVVGQLLRYIGYVKGKVAEPDQTVEGCIIALEDDPKLKWAISTLPHVGFYQYQVSFKLNKIK
jgi:restriction system protein